MPRQSSKQMQGQQMQPGQLFRVPGASTRSRWVPEGGNQNIRTTLQTGQTVTAPTVKFDQSDIIKAYLAVIHFHGTYTPGSGDTVDAGALAPMNLVNRLRIQYEATYAPVNLSGVMNTVFSLFRPVFAGVDGTVGLLLNATANAAAPLANKPGGQWPNATSLLTPTTGFTGALSGAYDFYLFYEMAVSICFDLYWPLNKTGSLASPTPLFRRIISPQYMAATTRNNVPVITFANPLQTGITAKNSGRVPLAEQTVGTNVPTFSGYTVTTIYRLAWFPGNRVATPPIDPWQYARQEFPWPTSGSPNVTVPLDSQEADQGQIMSLVAYVYDPAATTTKGSIVPLSHITKVALLYSSDVFIKNQTPRVNQFEWATKHGTELPSGFFGWDLALTDDGRLTNEECLNTLIQSGVQVRITFNQTHIPSASAQVYLGIESLKYVTQ